MNRRDCLGLAAASFMAPRLAQAQPSGPSPGLLRTWQGFRERFIQDGRVIDTGNNNIIHTEGIGVSLLAAQACNDRETFEAVRHFAQRLVRVDGLHAWNWMPSGGILDVNNASDGDLYMAWALLRGGVRWQDSRLIAQGLALSAALRKHCVYRTPKGTFLVPGLEGFITRSAQGALEYVVNPSYWALPAMRELGAAEANPQWHKAVEDSLTLLQRARFGPSRLPADWLMLTDPLMPWHERPARFGYEAIRVPLFLAWDRQFRHLTLKSCAEYMLRPGFAAWQDLHGPQKAAYAGGNGFEAVARITRRAVYGTPFTLPPIDSDYYSSSLVLLSALAASDLGWV